MNGRKAMQGVSGAEMLCKEQAARKSNAKCERRGNAMHGTSGRKSRASNERRGNAMQGVNGAV